MSRMAIASLSLLLLLVSVGILCAADINVTIKEWDTPGQNAGPHDTEVAKLAHIDRATFEIKEYLLPEGARPRRLAVAPDDRVYYSDHIRGYLGRLDPKTGKVEEWPSPGGPNSRPYAILTMSDGIVWYSESNVTPNTLVRFDPKDNSFMKWPIPSGGGVLRHFVATKDGKQIYIAGSGVNKVGIVDISRK